MSLMKRIFSTESADRRLSIAFLDTGISPVEDFILPENRIVAFRDFINGRTEPYDDNGHGTHVTASFPKSGLPFPIRSLTGRSRPFHCLPQKAFDRCTRISGQKAGMPGIQCRNLLHFRLRQRKIKNIQIFAHPFRMGGLHQRDNPTLGEPTQNHLRRRFPARRADAAKRFMMKQVILPGGQR